MNKYLDISREVREALTAGKPVAAPANTVISHGIPVTNPIPEEYQMDKELIDKKTYQALSERAAQGIHGKEITLFLLARVAELTGSNSSESIITGRAV